MTSLFMDRHGDIWRPIGREGNGEQLLACDEPRDPNNVGDPGQTDWPWTLRAVEVWFGPLVEVAPADAEQSQLAAVDEAVHEAFGRDESRWSPQQKADYLHRIDTVHAYYHPQRRTA